MADTGKRFGRDVVTRGAELLECRERGGWIDGFVVGSDGLEEWRVESV